MKKFEKFYKPRDYKTIDLWKNISSKNWNDPLWQLKNTIRSIEHLKKIITLSSFQYYHLL